MCVVSVNTHRLGVWSFAPDGGNRPGFESESGGEARFKLSLIQKTVRGEVLSADIQELGHVRGNIPPVNKTNPLSLHLLGGRRQEHAGVSLLTGEHSALEMSSLLRHLGFFFFFGVFSSGGGVCVIDLLWKCRSEKRLNYAILKIANIDL